MRFRVQNSTSQSQAVVSTCFKITLQVCLHSEVNILNQYNVLPPSSPSLVVYPCILKCHYPGCAFQIFCICELTLGSFYDTEYDFIYCVGVWEFAFLSFPDDADMEGLCATYFGKQHYVVLMAGDYKS